VNLTIANISKTITPAQLQAVVDALSKQVDDHFTPEWGIGATLTGTAVNLKHKAPIQGQHDAIIYVGDSHQDPTTGVENALGYHAVNYKDIPYGFVYLDITQEYGEVWTTTLSHEVLELLADPDAMLTVTGPAPNGGAGTVNYDLEVCDPTQGDSYQIDAIEVSNFVGRHYFELSGGTGNTNYLQLPLDPLGVRPGGYFQYEDGTGAHQIQGEKVSERMLAAKALLKAARRNARRALRFKVARPAVAP
jgi:hypothetical protein